MEKELKSETARVVLEARGISKSFPGVLALDGVDFKAHAGRLNAVVGENGAGKSTLMKILAGVCRPDRGVVLRDGQEVVFHGPRDAQARGIAIIHQELNLIPYLSVAENIFLGREFHNRFGLIDYRRMHGEAAVLLERLELSIDPRTLVAELRVGQQQIVEIAKALSAQAQVIIMDEPTSAISAREIDVLFRLIENLKQQGVAVVYITHKLDELFRIGDRVTVLRDGRWIGDEALADLDHDDIVRMMVGRDLPDLYKRTSSPGEEEVLRVEGLSLKHPEREGDFLVQDVDFHVRRGEVLGIFGVMGAGRTELLETLFGLHADRATGAVFLRGERLSLRSPRDAIDSGMGLAPEDRKREGLVPSMSLAANVSLGCLEKIKGILFLQRSRENELVEKYVGRLRIKTTSLRQAVETLSGGNQQKVVLAKWLATEPHVLLLDEPTRGIDISAKREIYRLIDELTQMGLAIVMVSSELPEILGVADRILVMSEGKITREFPREDATEESLLKAALPKSI